MSFSVSETQTSATNLIAELRQLEGLIDQVSVDCRVAAGIAAKAATGDAAHDSAEAGRALQQDFKRLEDNVVGEQTELQQLRALSDMSTRITNSLDVDTVLQETMELVIVLTQAERGYIILRNEDSGELEFRISSEGGLLGRGNGQRRRPADQHDGGQPGH